MHLAIPPLLSRLVAWAQQLQSGPMRVHALHFQLAQLSLVSVPPVLLLAQRPVLVG